MNDPAKNPYVVTSTTPGVTLFKGQGASTLNGAATTGAIITFALISGVVTMSAILIFVMSGPEEGQPLMRFDGDAMIFLAIGYGIFFASAIAAVFLRGVLKRQAIAQFRAADEEMPHPLEGNTPLPSSAQAFMGAVAAYTLIGQALMEGPAVINLILLFIEGNFAHAIPIVLGIIGITLQLPTVGKLRSLIEDAKQQL